jgi:hypothetical protein
MRVRLRAAYSPAELAELYPTPHNHLRWPDHILRVNLTIQVAHFLYSGGPVADLSCGDAAIANAVAGSPTFLGDLAPGYRLQGPLEKTIEEIPNVHLYICCETLEHLNDPDAALRAIREKTERLVLSTPIGEETGHNPEHYWGWDEMEVGRMLGAAGFMPVVESGVSVPAYGVAYQIWGCR